jgi:hypothetical protein
MLIERQIQRLRPIRAELQQIADLDAAEAPTRLAHEIGPEGDKQRRYVLSNERLVNKRLADFIMVRKASVAGTLDRLDLDRLGLGDVELQVTSCKLQDQLQVACCELQENPTGSKPVVGIVPGDRCDAGGPIDGPAAADGIMAGADNAEARPDDSVPAEVGAQKRAVSREYKASCDDENFLRNEATAGHEATTNEPQRAAESEASVERGADPNAPGFDIEKWYTDGIAKIRAERAETTRKLNEQYRREAEQMRLGRGLRVGGSKKVRGAGCGVRVARNEDESERIH